MDVIHELTPSEQHLAMVLEDDSDVEFVQFSNGPSTSIRTSSRKRKTKRQNDTKSKIQILCKRQKLQSPKEDADVTTKTLNECPICLESLEKMKISSTICGHVFCTKCISAAIRVNKFCPKCRTALTLEQIHPLYL